MDRVSKDVQEELDKILSTGVTGEELAEAKKGYLQAQKVGRSSDIALAGMLTNLRHLDRSMKFEADFEKKIENVTADQVRDALRKYVNPAKLVVVTAGDFDTKAASTVQ
jgi:zinc protease